jgi:hypothetical protein
MAYSQDVLTRIFNVQWGGVYVVIVARDYNYAVSNSDSVTVLDTRSEFLGGTGFPTMSGTLVECGSSAVDDFITLPTMPTHPLGLEGIYVFVCPHTDEVKNNWYDYVKSQFDGDFSDDNGYPLRPFFWFARTWSGSKTTMNFKIRFERITSDPGAAKIAQAYPTSGDTDWPSSNGTIYYIQGWFVDAYRLDKDGVGAIYDGYIPEWKIDPVITFSTGADPVMGLKFGRDPPSLGAAFRGTSSRMQASSMDAWRPFGDVIPSTAASKLNPSLG